jgi:hypothetical protein
VLAARGETNSESFVHLFYHPCCYPPDWNQGKIKGKEGERGRKGLVLLLGGGPPERT